MEFSPDNRQLAAAIGRRVTIFDVASESVIRTIEAARDVDPGADLQP